MTLMSFKGLLTLKEVDGSHWNGHTPFNNCTHAVSVVAPNRTVSLSGNLIHGSSQLDNAKVNELVLVNGIEALVLLDEDPSCTLCLLKRLSLLVVVHKSEERDNEKGKLFHKWPKKAIAFASQVNWLILPVIIFLDQRLSHACPRLNKLSVNLRMAH